MAHWVLSGLSLPLGKGRAILRKPCVGRSSNSTETVSKRACANRNDNYQSHLTKSLRKASHSPYSILPLKSVNFTPNTKGFSSRICELLYLCHCPLCSKIIVVNEIARLLYESIFWGEHTYLVSPIHVEFQLQNLVSFTSPLCAASLGTWQSGSNLMTFDRHSNFDLI